MLKLRATKKNVKNKLYTAHKTINILNHRLQKTKELMENINDLKLNELLDSSGIPKEQCILVKEIFSAAKFKNTKTRRYGDNWALSCMLFQIRYGYVIILGHYFKNIIILHYRSPSGYKYLREQNILPLPCVTTLRKYLLAVKIGCGFDADFFKLLKKKFENKTEYQKKMILVFDEIFLKESITVNTRTLSYLGLEDFGEGFNVRNSEKANHALVLMIQS